jgi:hypothetical protein
LLDARAVALFHHFKLNQKTPPVSDIDTLEPLHAAGLKRA